MSLNENIIQAVFDGNTEKLNEILSSHDIDLNTVTNRLGFRLIHIAAANNLINMVEELIARGVRVNEENDHGHTALDIAYQRENPDIVRLLENNGGVADNFGAPHRDIVFNNVVAGYWNEAPVNNEWADYHVARGPLTMGEIPILCHCDGDVY